MMQIVLIGLGAGTAAALLFASVLSGAPSAMLLLLLAPLPILIVALGWSHWAGLIAAAAAAACLAVLGPDVATAFLLGIGLPAWWLGYLALLARPAPAPNGHEWYPIGRLVLWAAGINALILTAAAVAGSFRPDLIGLSSSALAASLMIVHVLLGLAVIHAATLGLSGRGFVLGSVYAAIVDFSWPIRWPLMLVAVLGISDALFDLRGLIARRRSPPATAPPP